MRFLSFSEVRSTMLPSGMRILVIIMVGTLLAIGVHALVVGVARAVAPPSELDAIPTWYLVMQPTIYLVARAGPEFVAGWFCRGCSFLVGAIIGLCSSVVITILFNLFANGFGLYVLSWHVIAPLLSSVLAPTILGSLAAGAGELAHVRLHSESRVATPTGP